MSQIIELEKYLDPDHQKLLDHAQHIKNRGEEQGSAKIKYHWSRLEKGLKREFSINDEQVEQLLSELRDNYESFTDQYISIIVNLYQDPELIQQVEAQFDKIVQELQQEPYSYNDHGLNRTIKAGFLMSFFTVRKDLISFQRMSELYNQYFVKVLKFSEGSEREPVRVVSNMCIDIYKVFEDHPKLNHIIVNMVHDFPIDFFED